MTWYKTGTVAVMPGSNAVIGTGTSFIANSRVGDAFRGPDGGWYEVTNIASNTSLSIAPDYQGAAVAAGAYSLAPMQGYVKDSADALREATKTIAGGVTDMQEQVAAATEAAESAGQSKAAATEQAGIATAAAESSTGNKNAAQQAAQQSQGYAQASSDAAVRSETARDSIIQSEQAAAASAVSARESAERAEEVTEGKAASGNNNDITSLRALTADGFDRLRQGIAAMVGATAGAAGTKGLVPVPSVADRLKVLSGAGTWVPLPTGAAWGAITGTLSAQPDLQSALTDLGYAYISPSQTFANGGQVVLSHGLAVIPKRVTVEAECVVAENGYAVGAVYLLGEALQFQNTSGSLYGFGINVSATQITVKLTVGGLTLVHLTAGNIVLMAPANWRLRIKASKS